MRALVAASGGGGVLAALAAAGWLGALVLIGGVLIAAGMACWIVNDPGRSRRSALLIRSWRTALEAIRAIAPS